MTKPSPLTRTLPSGEHFVLSRHYQQGLLAALAPPGTPVVDVLVLSTDGRTIAATLQVKTSTRGAKAGWPFTRKHEGIVEDRLFYALVDFKASPPVTYVLPSAKVADVLRRSHQAWLKTPGKADRPHQDNPMRQLKWANDLLVEDYPAGWLDEWKERWDLIVEEVQEVEEGPSA
jgi:hypothetical protein